MPLVSVVIPSYNCGQYLRAAIDSILQQTLSDVEVIVVDDGSTDNTPQVMEHYSADRRVRYLAHSQSRGVSAARNHGAALATAEFVAFLDADDQWASEALVTMRDALLSSGLAWCVTDVLKVYTDRQVAMKSEVPAADFFYRILEDDFVRRAMFFRRAEFLAVGMYDENLRIREDWDLNIRMLESGQMFVYLAEPLYRYTWREGSLTTASQARIWKSTEHLLRKHHKRLADAGDVRVRSCYARLMWDLARRFFYAAHDPVGALRCIGESLQYDFSPGRLVHPLVRWIGVRAKP